MNIEAMRYAIMSGRIDVESPEEMKQGFVSHRRPCLNPSGCDGEMYFDGENVLRPGRNDEKTVNVYCCFRCGYAIMEEKNYV